MNYTNLAECFANTHSINRHIFLEIISKFMPHSKINVLDFGCGTGNYIKATDYCAARCDCLLHDGRKQNGQSYNGYLLQIFSFVCIRGSNDGTCDCGM